MSWFRRRSRAATADDGTVDAEAGTESADGTEPADEAGVEDVPAPSETAPDRSGGPFDAAEVVDDVQRIDLGALRVPAGPGTELRLEVEDKTQRVVAATVAAHGSTLQLQAFAAPRTEGVWSEIRAEIAAQVGKQGGSTEEVAGPFGRELFARMPARTADGRTGHRPARFIGVDGPRWFLRGVISGSAAVEPDAATELEAMLRGTVVVRGAEAMAPRDLLALTLPPPATRAPGAPGAAAGEPATAGTTDPATDGDPDAATDGDLDGDPAPERPRLAPPERGPEITERR